MVVCICPEGLYAVGVDAVVGHIGLAVIDDSVPVPCIGKMGVRSKSVAIDERPRCYSFLYDRHKDRMVGIGTNNARPYLPGFPFFYAEKRHPPIGAASVYAMRLGTEIALINFHNAGE
ncbi:MAG: hypothetical protein A2946_03040 [Candidatus Liptonbacteria bacterium RIFCSPLOWO2_01_FULL_53_13]|uniref:Uncharacterized protein n=1 Tax=Candidatus Liptonbacteria bacterium RIFCSPLOWO2_01_FULL_53_13 TaxID=1798651 RepID=A0A1G2CIL8_9BACT|nr:MAG: hypothetical protein A2946_03040 [Candidatus Liptonbacteria bacterium RIFCSPLOWO2_01_FULL_53_13]